MNMFKNLLSDIGTGMAMGRTQTARDAVMRTLGDTTINNIKKDIVLNNIRTLPRTEIESLMDDINTNGVDNFISRLSPEEQASINSRAISYINSLKQGTENVIPYSTSLPSYTTLPSNANFYNKIGQTLVHPNTKGIGLVGTGIGVGTLASNWGNQSEPMIVEAMETYGTGGTAYIDPNTIATEYAYTSPPLDEYLMTYQ